MICFFCQRETSITVTEVEHANGTKHLKRTCGVCHSFLGYQKQDIPLDEFKMPFGKYKGETIPWIYQNDFQYFCWGMNNLSGSVKERFDEVRKMNGFP